MILEYQKDQKVAPALLAYLVIRAKLDPKQSSVTTAPTSDHFHLQHHELSLEDRDNQAQSPHQKNRSSGRLSSSCRKSQSVRLSNKILSNRGVSI